MSFLVRAISFATLPLLLTGCDIERVSEGTWDIQADSPEGARSTVWIITDEPSVTISATTESVATEVDLQGSRIFWSTETPDPSNPSGPMLRETFVGTVNGDSLAGTIYTTGGNYSVTGTRR